MNDHYNIIYSTSCLQNLKFSAPVFMRILGDSKGGMYLGEVKVKEANLAKEAVLSMPFSNDPLFSPYPQGFLFKS